MAKKVIPPDNESANLVVKLEKENLSLKTQIVNFKEKIVDLKTKNLKLAKKVTMLEAKSKKLKSQDFGPSFGGLAERMQAAGVIVPPDHPGPDPILEKRRKLQEAKDDTE